LKIYITLLASIFLTTVTNAAFGIKCQKTHTNGNYDSALFDDGKGNAYLRFDNFYKGSWQDKDPIYHRLHSKKTADTYYRYNYTKNAHKKYSSKRFVQVDRVKNQFSDCSTGKYQTCIVLKEKCEVFTDPKIVESTVNSWKGKYLTPYVPKKPKVNF